MRLEDMKTMDLVRESYIPEKVERLRDEEMQWFRDSKFGMFIHWGLYSTLEKGEWVLFSEKLNVREYSARKAGFTAEEYNPRAWARAAREAGMKYMVLTTRHHDGFCLFDSKTTDFTSMNSGAHKDLVKEYVEACRAEGLKVGLYYSPMDWRFPGYYLPELFWDSAMEMKRQCHEQLEELMTNYGKIDLLWFDGEWLALGGLTWDSEKSWHREDDWIGSKFFQVNYFWESEKIINRIRELQPGIMINNRFGWEGDFHVRERRIDGMRTDKPWDSNDCIADSWGYVPNRPVMTLEQLTRNFISVIVRDGNYLLNVGPTGTGRMVEEQVSRLKEMGDWIEQYKESIYKTRGGPIMPGEWGGCVYRDNIVYAHIISWREDEIGLALPQGNRLVSCSCLTGEAPNVREEGSELILSKKPGVDYPCDTILKMEFADNITWEGATEPENDVYGLGDGLHLK